MILGPKYKIARRLGAPIFEKTQTQKFAQSETRKGKNRKRRGGGQKTDYAIQQNEKQKARFTYQISEKQFSNYVREAIAEKGKSTGVLFEKLELRLDNAVYRIGIAKSRSHARQIVTHGHMKVNGRRVDIPSYRLSVGDVISIREGSLTKTMFANIEEMLADRRIPSWISFDIKKKEARIEGLPKMENEELLFNLGAVIEFYSR